MLLLPPLCLSVSLCVSLCLSARRRPGSNPHCPPQGLGTGPTELIPLEERTWYEGDASARFRYELQRRPETGRWRLINDRCAGFSGFTVKLDSSAASPAEFESMHHRYWNHPDSSFVRRGPCALRVLADGSAYLRLIGRTLQRTSPPIGNRLGASKLAFPSGAG